MVRICLTALLLLMLTACSTTKPIISENEILQTHEKLDALVETKTVTIVDGPYLGAETVPLSQAQKSLSRRIDINAWGTLDDICESAGEITDITWHVESLNVTPIKHIRYNGTINAFCDFMALQFGYVWEYNHKTNSIIFSDFATQTFTLISAPGLLTYENSITNESGESNSGGSGDSVGSGSIETEQSSSTALSVDVWEEAVTAVKGFLSKQGVVSSNVVAGTITVSDYAPVLRNVRKFIGEYNNKLRRQVALQVRVWQLVINDTAELGIGIEGKFHDGGHFGLSTGSASISSGELIASLSSSKFEATAMLKALSQYGKASLVTSGSGITMNNQPLPVQNVVTDTYIAESGVTVSDNIQQVEITPGQVTTGFSMTVIPHILDRRTLILQYNASLSSLDDIRSYQSGDTKIEMPVVSNRAFSQRVTMRMGQTLVLAGFEQETNSRNNTLSPLEAGRSGKYGRSIIVITISAESVPGYDGEALYE